MTRCRNRLHAGRPPSLWLRWLGPTSCGCYCEDLRPGEHPLARRVHDDVPGGEVRRIHLSRTRGNRGKGPYRKENAPMSNRREEPSDRLMAESQLSELQNMRVLLEEARGLSRNLAYHRRARLESRIGEALEEVDQQRTNRYSSCGLPGARIGSSKPTPHQHVHHEHC